MLNAITCVWNEEDIIAASVKNCFAQGCDNVFIVDNASTDNTVPRALAAGARLALSFESKFFDERQKIVHLNAVVSFFNKVFPDPSIWWLYFDADEFPCIANGSRLADLVAGLDRAVIGLHGYLSDHIPTHAPYSHEERHPADFMPLCEKSDTYKIPLLRYDKGRPHFFSAGGAHEFNSNGESVLVAMDALDIHHFPVRNPKHTLTRLKNLLQRSPDGSSRVDWMDQRSRYLNKKDKSHYHERYESMRERYLSNKFRVLKCRDLSYDFTRLRRWYDACEDRSWPELDDFDNALCRAVLQYFLGRHDVALCRFNDALNAGAKGEVALWITIKMAECFAHANAESDAEAARLLLAQAHASGNSEVRAYIDAHLAGILRGDKPSAARPAAAPPLAFRVEPYQSTFKIDPAYMQENMRQIMERLARLHG